MFLLSLFLINCPNRVKKKNNPGVCSSKVNTDADSKSGCSNASTSSIFHRPSAARTVFSNTLKRKLPQKVNLLHPVEIFTHESNCAQENVSTSTSRSNFVSHGVSSVGVNVLGLRKSARIMSRLSNTVHPIAHDVTIVCLSFTSVSARNRRVTGLGKRKHMCDFVFKQPMPIFSDGVDLAHSPAPFLSTVDRFQPQTVLKSKSSGLWNMFDACRTNKLGKRKRSNSSNGSVAYMSGSTDAQVNQFFSLNDHCSECKPSGIGSCMVHNQGVVRTPSGNINVSNFNDSITYASGSTDVQIAHCHLSNISSFQQVSRVFEPSGNTNSEESLTAHWTDQDTKHDSPTQVYLRHADGDPVANFTRSSVISTSLSVTSDRDINEPTLMRANTLTANISLIAGTNVGNGVPDDDL